MDIRRLTKEDIPAIKAMPTGITDDYVLRILNHAMDTEAYYGGFLDGQLVTYGAITVYEDTFAFFGRLRTHIHYRNHGCASNLLSYLKETVSSGYTVPWIGLTTVETNTPVHKISKLLNLDLLTKFVACRVEPYDLLHELKAEPSGKARFLSGQAAVDFIHKHFPSIEDLELKVFPYACYYPVPIGEKLLGDRYLKRHEVIVNQGTWLLTLNDKKGTDYLHLKYFFRDIDERHDLLAAAALRAAQENRTLWIDLSYEMYTRLKELIPSLEGTEWRLYGASTTQY